MVDDGAAGSPRIAVPRELSARPVPARDRVPCVARPSAGMVHLDGRCECFFGGPAPVFMPPSPPA